MINRRKFIRFATDKNTIVAIDIEPFEGDEFNEKSVGLVVDESQQGFSAIILTVSLPPDNAICKVKVGNMGILKAQVKWIRSLAEDVARVGFEFLE